MNARPPQPPLAGGLAAAVLMSLLLAACGSQPPRPVAGDESAAKPSRPGAYYQDDGPGDNPPANLAAIPDAEPRSEPLHRYANNPYSVLGRDYVPMKEPKPYKARGVASWYGRKFHGQKTSSGEPYDMYGMSAAHPTLPIPSYARVTNLANGKSVVVRVNDRGPFHANRVIDLSYAAAWKLGYIGSGSATVEVESILPGGAPAPAAMAGDPIAGLAAGTPAPEQKALPPPEVSDQRGIFLQLGAFGSQDNAETFRARLYRQLAWLSGAIHIQPQGETFRLHLGPYRDAREAHRVADRIREALDFKPFVVQR